LDGVYKTIKEENLFKLIGVNAWGGISPLLCSGCRFFIIFFLNYLFFQNIICIFVP